MRHGAKILSMAIAGTLLLGACESRQDRMEQRRQEQAQELAEFEAMTPIQKFHNLIDPESIETSLSDADISALGWGYCEFWQANNHNPEPAMAQLDEWIIHDFNVSPTDALVIHAYIRMAFCEENY